MNEKQTTAKDFFIYLGALIALYVSVISLLNLLFAIINHAFPDALAYYGGESYTIRWTISSLIILFPLYIYFAKVISKDVLKKEFWIRKCSKYLTLFLTGGAIVGDLIVLINTFLGGEISIRFVLKVIAVFIVAGFTFYYHACDTHKHPNLLITIASLIVLASIVGGFLTVGSPAKQRAIRFDEERINDLNSIQAEVTYYWQKKKVLPTTLSELNDPLRSYAVPNDPKTELPYEYSVTDKNSFKICAVFETEGKQDTYYKPLYSWPHTKERTCFNREIDPELYPTKL